MAEEKKKKGCLFYGAIIAGIMIVVIVIGAVVGLRYARGIVDQFVDAEPVPLPRVEFSDEQADRLQDRIEAFRDAVLNGRRTPPLILTANEINVLIATSPDLALLRDRLFVMIEGNELKAQMSFPAEELGMEPLRGRYVNAEGTFDVGLSEEGLHVSAKALFAKGKPLPSNVMRQLSVRNLADRMNDDARARAGISRLQDVQVKDGAIVITPKEGPPAP